MLVTGEQRRDRFGLLWIWVGSKWKRLTDAITGYPISQEPSLIRTFDIREDPARYEDDPRPGPQLKRIETKLDELMGLLKVKL